jgi:hypothetical protein
MADLSDIDTTNAADLGDGFEPFPAGEYVLYLEESERKESTTGKGAFLNCTFIVKEGEFQGRKVFHRFLLWNPEPKNCERAKSEWRALCEAAINQPKAPDNDSTKLHYQPFVGTVKVVPPKDNYGAKNEMVFLKGKIKSLAEQGSRPVGVAAPQQQPAQQTAPATAGVTQTAPAAAATGGAARPAWAKR